MGLIEINTCHGSIQSVIWLTKTLNWIIPFIVGVVTALLLDQIRRKRRNRKLKNFTLFYLEDSILPSIPELRIEFQKINEQIQSIVSEKTIIKDFETLSIESLITGKNTEYFDIFGKDISIFNDIKSTLKFLITNLPFALIESYFQSINEHLKEKNKIGDINHIKTCHYCIDKRHFIELTVKQRFNELDGLEKKIMELLKRHKS